MKVSLEVTKGPETGRVFEFTDPDIFIVGRSKDAHFRLANDDPYVSRKHFLLEISPPRVMLKDLDSKNKPVINGIAQIEAELNDGDVIEVGYTSIKVGITQDIKACDIRCLKCGEMFQIIDGEVPPAFCLKCIKEIENERLQALAPKTVRVFCSCGRDITEAANHDGRADLLQGLVRYCCEHCIESLKSGEDAGKIIADYEVIKVLGQGGMGKVYQVCHRPTRRILALKQLLNLNDKQLIKRFSRETRYMQEINHPNAIRYIGSGESSEGPYLVMEMAYGGNLQHLLEKNNHSYLKVDEAVQYIEATLEGLEYIHKMDIVHRDLKPENILLQEAENGLIIPKITDFGLAKKYGEAGGTIITKFGVCMGTAFFIPPEQILDARSVRAPADIYSLGVTLYYLLTGQFPYNFPTSLEIIRYFYDKKIKFRNMAEAEALFIRIKNGQNPYRLILEESPTPIRENKPDIPLKLATIVDKAVKKDPGQRFQTAAEFRQALLKIL